MPKSCWTQNETYALINYIEEKFEAYTTGVKENFYQDAQVHVFDENKTTAQIKTKCNELEKKYIWQK